MTGAMLGIDLDVHPSCFPFGFLLSIYRLL